MLDIKRIREDFDGVKAAVERREKGDFGLDRVKALDEERRSVLAEVEAMKNKQNTASREVPKLKKEGKDTSALFAEMKELSNKIKELDGKVAEIEEELRETLLGVPNTPNPEVPEGNDDADNVEIRKVGEPRSFDFDPKAHWDIGEAQDILDFERAGKIAGARFTVYKGAGAKLERALINFMLDLHTEEQGYT
ncbi:MAG: serine--tRNA ligase, partial [Mogibacterium sp.]|nr:serine--tRNA ligase [Mogibacterium sp.]